MSDNLRALVTRAGLASLALTAGGIGVWAQFAPRSFYEDFPFGRGWVALDGPYNEHLVRDVGGLNLALAVLTVAALVLVGPTLVRVAAVGWLVYAVPHLAYHVRHLEAYEPTDRVLNLVGLLASVVVPALLLVIVPRERPVRDEDRHVSAST
jgi:hypothetical protein